MAKKVNSKLEAPEEVLPQRHEEADASVEKRLIALYKLQQIDSQIDKIRIIRGELPLEVQDLEDEIAGLETRIEKFEDEKKSLEQNITDKKNMIKECKTLITKYTEQQKNVRNNREARKLNSKNWKLSFAKKELKNSHLVWKKTNWILKKLI